MILTYNCSALCVFFMVKTSEPMKEHSFQTNNVFKDKMCCLLLQKTYTSLYKLYMWAHTYRTMHLHSHYHELFVRKVQNGFYKNNEFGWNKDHTNISLKIFSETNKYFILGCVTQQLYFKIFFISFLNIFAILINF